MTILNSMPIGGLDQAFRWVSLDNVASPENEYSAPPENLAILSSATRKRECERGIILPLNDIIAAFPFCATVGTPPFPICGIQGSRNSDENISCVKFGREVCFYCYFVGYSGSRMFCYYWVDTEWKMNI